MSTGIFLSTSDDVEYIEISSGDRLTHNYQGAVEPEEYVPQKIHRIYVAAKCTKCSWPTILSGPFQKVGIRDEEFVAEDHYTPFTAYLYRECPKCRAEMRCQLEFQDTEVRNRIRFLHSTPKEGCELIIPYNPERTEEYIK